MPIDPVRKPPAPMRERQPVPLGGRIPHSVRASDTEWRLVAEEGRLKGIPEPSAAARVCMVIGAEFLRFVRETEAHIKATA